MKPRRLAACTGVATAALALLWPVASEACAVCFGGSGRSRLAFFETTVLMSLLPLGLIGSGLWWLRRGGGLLAGEFEERDATSPPETPDSVPTAQGPGDAPTAEASRSGS